MRKIAAAVILLVLGFDRFTSAAAVDEVKIIPGDSCGEKSRHILLQNSSENIIIAFLIHSERNLKSDTEERAIPPKTTLVVGCDVVEGDSGRLQQWKVIGARYVLNTHSPSIPQVSESGPKPLKAVGIVQALIEQEDQAKNIVGVTQELAAVTSLEEGPSPDKDDKQQNDKPAPSDGRQPRNRRIDPEWFSKSFPSIKLTVKIKSGTKIPPWVRSLVPKSQLAKIEGKPGSALVTIEQPTVGILKRLADEPAIVSINLNRPTTLGPPPPYIRPVDIEARRSHLVEEFLTENGAVTGSGVVGAIFDEGEVRGTHVEFRKLRADSSTSTIQVVTKKPLSRHSSHVAGIISARGVNAVAIGMAPDVRLLSYDWDNDLLNLSGTAPRVQFSSHSYGPMSGWSQDPRDGTWLWFGDLGLSKDEDAQFGKYGETQAQLDTILYRNSNLLTFVAAGNVRGFNPPSQPVAHLHRDINSKQIAWIQASDTHENSDHKQGGLDTLSGLGISKNSICIGSIEPIDNDRQIAMTSYSSWGPTDDGRIKPDLVANGQKLISISSAADDAYLPMSGTSMATPAAAGIAALLVQHFRISRHRQPLSSDIKAILIHSADDAGPPGPDAMFGWGAINALTAGRVISKKNEHLIEEGNLAETQTKEYKLEANGQPIRVTIVWTDPAGDENKGGLNDATPSLKDDLDLELTSPNGTLYYPYSLDPNNPLAPARHDRPNKVDNVEEIDTPSQSGFWTVRVKATKLTAARSQKYSLVTSGFIIQTPPTSTGH